MKYWFFDGNDVVGPFTPQELAARADFSVNTGLVCPEKFSEDEDSWKLALSFTDFGPDALSSGSAVSAPVKPAPPEAGESSPEETALFDEEMDTFLKNPSILAGTAAPAPESPSLEIPKKPAKPAGPIEDYFNNINGEDLGDILGIPDPNENSDMNLPRVMEGHFDSTTPPTDKLIDSAEASSDEDETDLPPIKTQRSPAVSVPPVVRQPLPVIQPVKRLEPLVSVPMSLADEDALLVLPGEKLSGTEPARPVCAAETKSASAAGLPARENKPAAGAEKPEEKTTLPPADKEPQKTLCTEKPAPAKEEPLKKEPLPSAAAAPVKEQEKSHPAQPENAVPQEKPSSSADEALQKENSPVRPEPAQQAPSSVQEETPEKEKAPAASAPAKAPRKEESVPAAKPQPQDAKNKTVRDILRGELALPANQGKLQEPLKTVPMSPRLNQVKPKLKQTPEIEQFLNTQRQQIQLANERKANVMLWVLAVLLLAGVIVASLHYFGQPVEEDSALPASVQESEFLPDGENPSPRVDSLAGEPIEFSAGEPATPAAAALPLPVSAADKALAAVQNHQLPAGKGTIASYFDRFYKNQLSQGYSGEWSAEALHKNTYIVKYRLSKTRVEPVVYVFQADAARGKLTGALNNIALDLVGRI